MHKCKCNLQILILYRYLLLNNKNLGIEVQFCWAPAHIGIKGNEKAGNMAKEALEKSK